MKKLKYLLFIPALILAFIFPINTLYAQSNHISGDTIYTDSYESQDYKLESIGVYLADINDTLYSMSSIRIYLSNSTFDVLDVYFSKPTKIQISITNINVEDIDLIDTVENVRRVSYVLYQDAFGDYSIDLVFYNIIDDILYSIDSSITNEAYLYRYTQLYGQDAYDQGYADGLEDAYQDGYDKGEEAGIKQGNQQGIDQGYNEAKGDYGIYYEDEWLTAEQYAVIKVNEKVEQLGDLELSIVDFVPGILGAIFSFFFTLSSMSILGISILDILILVFGVGAVIFVIKLFIK